MEAVTFVLFGGRCKFSRLAATRHAAELSFLEEAQDTKRLGNLSHEGQRPPLVCPMTQKLKPR